MHTTITKKVKGSIMETLFDKTDLINIRFFKNKNIKSDKDYSKEEVYLYEITIRHNEDEDPKKILNNAIKQLN